MADVMVTARMSAEKKESAVHVLDSLGANVNQAINGLFDYIIRNKELPYEPKQELGLHKYTEEELREAAAYVDSLVMPQSRFANMTRDEIRHERLAAKGLL